MFKSGSSLIVLNMLTMFGDSIGIPHDKLSVIFEDFEQVESTLSQTVQGAGLGLAIVARIVKNMNG
jgi:signal transduction histidine kinase